VKHCGEPAAYVVRDLEGLEWFVCAAHGETATPAAAATSGSQWITRTPFAEWFQARALEVPPEGSHVCNEARADQGRWIL
jgi:hypothetical protein